MSFRHGADDKQTEAASLGANRHAVDPVEAPEDTFQLVRRDAGAAILHFQCVAGTIGSFLNRDRDARICRGVLDGVVDQVPDSRLQFVGVADNDRRSARPLFIRQRIVAEMKTGAGQRNAFPRDLGEVDPKLGDAPEVRLRAAGSQDLFDGVQQPVAVFEHRLVELPSLRLVQLARQQCLQVEADRGDWCLELVSDGVDERVVLLVAPDLADEKDGVEHHPGNDDEKEDEAEDHQDAAAPADDHPADVQCDGDGDQADAERGEEDDGAAAPADHDLRRIQE